MEQELAMSFKIGLLLLLLLTLLGCDLREDDLLPSGISPFDLIDNTIYITKDGLYASSENDVYLLIKHEENQGFTFISDSYSFDPASESYSIKFVDASLEEVEVEDFTPLIAIPSQQFTYLGLKYQGDYERFYPYPTSLEINGYGAYYSQGYCFFLLNDSGYYQTFTEEDTHSSITVEIDSSQEDDINVSLYQAQFILPRILLPLGVQEIKLEEIESENLADYKLTLLDLPVNFNMIEDNPDAERYPIIYIPLPAETDTSDTSEISVTQILPDHREKTFTYNEDLDSPDQYTIYGNSIILHVNNQGEFIINKEKFGENK